MRLTGERLQGLRVEKIKLLPYHALARSKYRALGLPDTMPETAAPSEERIEHAAEILRGCGLNAVSGRQ